MHLREIGKRISDRRKSLGYTQEQLAEMMDVSIQMISNLERGNKAIKIDNLLKVSKLLQVSTDYILTGEQSESEISSKLKQLSDREYRIVCKMVDYILDEKKE